jgi:hypothetical protein
MVEAVAEAWGLRMLGSFGCMLYGVLVLLPFFEVASLPFLRGRTTSRDTLIRASGAEAEHNRFPFKDLRQGRRDKRRSPAPPGSGEPE